MLRKGELTLPFPLARLLVFITSLELLVGCAGIKNAPENVPFMYNNQVTLNTKNLKTDDRNQIVGKLLEYIDDSLKVPTRQVLGITQRLKPPVFDSSNLTRSVIFMNGYLNSLGYYGATFDSITVKFDTVQTKKQIRVTNHYFLTLGRQLKVDTLIYSLNDSELQRLADSSKPESNLTKGRPYSKEAAAAELDRLGNLFRNRGFMKMGRSTMLIEVDTTDPSLMDLSLDPIQQLLIAQSRRENPLAKLTVLRRPGIDSNAFRQYYIDSVCFFVETRIADNTDSLLKDETLTTTKIAPRYPIYIKERAGFYKHNLIRRNNYLLPGTLYRERNYFRTINAFSQIGPWDQSFLNVNTYTDSIGKANFNIFLYPSKKQTLQVDLEGSQNTNISVSNVLSGQFLALSVGATNKHRNFLRAGVQSVTTGRFGFELNNNSEANNENFFQTLIGGFTQSFSIPRLLWPLQFLDKRNLDARRTAINMAYTYTNRFEFFQQTSVGANLQWEWRKGRNTYNFVFPNFESVDLVSTDSLKQEIIKNPSLALSFTPGNILSVRGSFQHAMQYKKSKYSGFYRVGSEFALPVPGELFGREFFKFIRFDGQIIHRKAVGVNSWNYRLFAGVGFRVFSRNNKAALPYFRQFVAGGNNSMRAWPLRLLGVGYSISNDTATYKDRFGDIQLETNVEYRFRIARLFGFNLDGAAFADIGNIWNRVNNVDGYGKFDLSKLYRDLGVCAGTGLRWDFTYLIIRLDLGFKLKDPVRAGNGWLTQPELKSPNRIEGYPENRNYALQFGIGYPF